MHTLAIRRAVSRFIYTARFRHGSFAPRRAPRAHHVKSIARIAIIIAALALAVGSLFAAGVQPIVTELARAEAREYAVRAINAAVEDEISSGKLRYSELVTLEKDGSGAVTALVTDMTKINLLQSRVSNKVAENIVNLISTEMYVPLGDAFGWVLLSGRGPKIPIKVESVTDVRAKLVNDFDSGGINQTRHRITLSITADIAILIPGSRASAAVSSDVAVAETIIVGGVPNVYARTGS